MRKFILFLPFLSFFSAAHVYADKSSQWAAWSFCLQGGHREGTPAFNNCLKEQEDRAKRQEECSIKQEEELSRQQKDRELKQNKRNEFFKVSPSGVEK